MTDKKTLNLIIFSSATIISDQPEEIKKETKYYLSFSFGLTITDWGLSLPRSDSNGCPDFL